MTPIPHRTVDTSDLPEEEFVPEHEAGEWRQGKYLSVLAIVLYFAIWFAITNFDLVASYKFPSPQNVARAAITTREVLLQDILATVGRVLSGLTVGVILGVGLGLLMSYNKKIFYFCDPLIESMRPVPVIAMIPFFLLWFGIAEKGKLLLVTLGVFTIMVVSTVEAVRNVPRIYMRAAATLGASRNQIFRMIVLPAILPALIGTLRVAAALSFTLVVAAEFMGAQSGLGYLINDARRLFNPDVIMLGILLFGVLSAILDTIIRKLTTYLTRWTERTQ